MGLRSRDKRNIHSEEFMRRHARRMTTTMMVLAGLAVGATPDAGLKTALEGIKADRILGHIKVLASDEFEGRGPGTPGEAKTIAYLTAQFREMGLKPGNPDGTFLQAVPLVGFQAQRVSGSFQAGGRAVPLS